MNAVRRLAGLFRDSPTYGRDRANLISGFSIGTAGLLLNGAVLILVLPLMLDPDDRDFRVITENVEFGQLLALILLGGATAFATYLIPLRLVTVFWGPRGGRYFDQIVLSGITPMRFVIGKATSQNLFLALILFLLLPWMVLSMTLGGVEIGSFLAGVFLIWLYCMALALVTLWLSLYLNELLAAWLIMGGATILSVLGCLPFPMFQPFVVTPFPALIHPLYTSLPFFDGRFPHEFAPVFFSCAIGMSIVICVSLFAIYLGPLYGITRENSTFGEVVKVGDNRKKRWFRLRLHIQRPSEIAFFYENRAGDGLARYEGLIRWGAALTGLTVVSLGASLTLIYFLSTVLIGGGTPFRYWVYDFHVAYLVIHGCGLVLAAFVFSHARNSTLMSVPVVPGVRAKISTLDTLAFVAFLMLSTGVAMATPVIFHRVVASPAGHTMFPDLMWVTEGRPVDYVRIATAGVLAISTAGVLVYCLHRYVCLLTWVRSLSFAGIAGFFFLVVCLLPMPLALIFMEVEELSRIPAFEFIAPRLAMLSPVVLTGFLFNEMGGDFPDDLSLVPHFALHLSLIAFIIFRIRRRSRNLNETYLTGPAAQETPE